MVHKSFVINNEYKSEGISRCIFCQIICHSVSDSTRNSYFWFQWLFVIGKNNYASLNDSLCNIRLRIFIHSSHQVTQLLIENISHLFINLLAKFQISSRHYEFWYEFDMSKNTLIFGTYFLLVCIETFLFYTCWQSEHLFLILMFENNLAPFVDSLSKIWLSIYI